MSIPFTELRNKEVICIDSGQRLGFVSDVQVEIPEGTVRALVVPCLNKLGMMRREDYVLPWSCIRKIGPDIILVETQPDSCRCPRGKPRQMR